MLRSFAVALIFITSYCSISYADIPLVGAVRTDPAPGMGDYTVPFYPGGTYRDDVRPPGEFLGYPIGSKPAPQADILRYFEYLDTALDNVSLHEYGHTYEGRRLVYLVVTSQDNAAHLGAIREGLGRLADPRGVSDAQAQSVIENSPAVAWLGYGIHGDELSSCDAALWLAYQLAAETDEATERLRERLIVCIDPLQNPDGRNRWLAMLDEFNSVVPSHDVQSLQHRGVWPQGRANHYLFDLNRDWFSLVHPETRGRTEAILEWMPQYVLDCHEMGPTDTYLFSPPREPFNPYLVGYIHKWWDRVASDQETAFDQYGWSYYTREWNEEFFPGYGSSWGIYLGAVGMLFEQAGVDGSRVKRPEGTIMTYRETVHHQFVGSWSNLTTIADGHKELLADYYKVKRDNVRSPRGAFVLPPADDRSRLERLVETLRHQHIEVETADDEFRAGDAVSNAGERERSKTFPEGTVVVRTRQPLRQLVEVILTPDIRIPTAFLETERKEILKNHSTRLYDTTGWSLPHAYGLEAWFVPDMPKVSTTAWESNPPPGGLDGEDSPVGFVFGCTDDRSYLLLAALLQRDYNVWASREPFEVAGHEYARGSFLIRRNGNPDLDVEALRDLAEQFGVEVVGAGTGRGGDLADLGGNEFRLLEKPRVAIVGGNPIAYTHYGAIWHLVDARLRMRSSQLDVASLGRVDLAKYNVLVLPSTWGGAMAYKRMLGDGGVHAIKDWVHDGGTLIAEGNAAAFLADTSVAVSSVRLRRQSLDKLALYDAALAAERDAEDGVVDSLAVWGEQTAEPEQPEADKKTPAAREVVAQADERARRLFPRGAVLAADIDQEHWLASGCNKSVPVMFDTDYAFLARDKVQVAARLAPRGRLRLAGLVWPQATVRWAQTAYATRERSGRGQVILFATLPDFRGYFYGSERLLLNALLLGPGMGTSRTIEW